MSKQTMSEQRELHERLPKLRWKPSFYSITDRLSHALGVLGQVMHVLMYFCVASLAYQAARVLGAFADGRVMFAF